MNETPESYDDMARLFRAIPAGQFPAAFADLWCRLGAADRLGVGRTYLEALGVRIESAGREISRGRQRSTQNKCRWKPGVHGAPLALLENLAL